MLQRPNQQASGPRSHGLRSKLLAVSLILLSFGCSDSDGPSEPTYVAASFTVTEGIAELQVSDAEPGTELTLYDAQGEQVAQATADAQGKLDFTGLVAGAGYVIRETSGDTLQQTDSLDVFAAASFTVTAGGGELEVSGAEPGSDLVLYDAQGEQLAQGTADTQGRIDFTGLAVGAGYFIREDSADTPQQTEEVEVLAAATFAVQESVRQLQVTDAKVGISLTLFGPTGEALETGSADALGSLVFRLIEPGRGYVIQANSAEGVTSSRVLQVFTAEELQPEAEFYSDQILEPGYNYIRTRDGTTLSAYVFLPGPLEEGPYPVIVNYSGYAPSKPGEPFPLGEFEDAREALCGIMPVLCDAPNHPAGLIAGIFGFASVGVNMRGTGCSGGAYDFFDELQVTDGYDLIEVIASQEWVAHNQVGMAGLSYPGISQLFVAKTRPPGLASIAPMSVIANTATSTLAPGGLFNNGFAFEWAENVYNDAQPYGQGWSNTQIELEAESGTTTCDDNQKLHGQAVDAVSKALEYPYYDAEVADPINPSLFVGEIDVPVFLTGAWQDEQTGGHFAALLDKFTRAPAKRFTVFNGLHADGYVPQILSEWLSFLDLYVAKEVPSVPQEVASISAALFEGYLGVAIPLPVLPFSKEDVPGITYEEALAGFEAQHPLRVIFDNGAAQTLLDADKAGGPVGAFEHEFSQWPPTETVPLRLYLNADGTLRETPPEEQDSASSFLHDPEAGQRTLGGEAPFYEWPATPADSAVVFVSDPLSDDTVMLGHGSVDLYIRSDALDADLEVLLSEIRPDGNETYVQTGWQRASQRHLAESATPLRPIKTHLEADASLLPEGVWTRVRIEIFPFGHVFRAGSRIGIQVDTPGDSRELWKFILNEFEGDVRHSVAHSVAYPSSVLLPVVAGVTVPSDLPPCPSLRGQPCRLWEPYVNTLDP